MELEGSSLRGGRLTDLLVDSGEVAEELLVSTLKPCLSIDRSSHDIIWAPEAQGLTARQKILAFLLALRALAQIGGRQEDAICPAVRVAESCGLKRGTAYPQLMHLRQDGLVRADKHGSYWVPVTALRACAAELTKSQEPKPRRRRPTRSSRRRTPSHPTGEES